MRRPFLLALSILAVSISESFVSGAMPAFAQEDDAPSQRRQQVPTDAIGPSSFDGTYSVDVTTQDGDCGNSQWTVVVSHRQIESVTPNNDGITATGLIEDDGTVSMTFRGRKSDFVHVGGTVKARAGKGAWSAPTLLCGGIWRAQKK